MTHLSSLSLSLSLSLSFAIPACGFPRPPSITDDAATVGDAAAVNDAAPGVDAAGADAAVSFDARPGTTIRVAGTGDDANDGINAPVKTLKHAIGLAAADGQVTSIVLASGRYESAGGEIFPYTLPANIILSGPAGGGAILAGTNTEPGMIVKTGALQDLELESFSVAVTATGVARLTNLHVRTGALAVRAETAAKLTIDNVDIAGTPGGCASGIDLNGTASLTSATLVTRNLKTSVTAKDQSVLTLSAANLAGDGTCGFPTAPGAGLVLSTTKSLTLDDSLIDGGGNGISFLGTVTPSRATIRNTVIRNVKTTAIDASKVTLEVTGGELSGADFAMNARGANIKLTGVAIKHSRGFSVQLGDGGAFVMRNCVSTENGGGVYLYGNMAVDLGTASSPGNNIFQNGNTTGLEIDAGVPGHVDAVGNTWRPNIQGADSAGHYAAATITGPVGYTAQSNYSVSTTGSLRL